MATTSTRVPVLLGLHSNEAPSPAESVERLVNGYLETTPNGKEASPVYGIPGFTLFATPDPSDPIRGMLEVKGVLYVVAGDNIYRVDSSGTSFNLFSPLSPSAGGVSMASDGKFLVVANRGPVYVHDIVGGTTVLVSDPDVLVTDRVAYLDGYFIFSQRDSGEWFISDLQDPTSYDPLNFSSAERKPDDLVLPLALGSALLLFGKTSLEGQTNTGGLDFPFSRLQDLSIDVGIAGPDAAVVSNETVYWLASDGTVRRLDGSTAKRISTNPIERIIAGWSQQDTTIATSHVWLGHLFIAFRNGEGCIVYDQSTDRWHERESEGVGSWAVLYSADCYGKRLFSRENRIYAMNAASADDVDTPISLVMVTPFVSSGGRRFSVNELELLMQTGSGEPGTGVVTVQATRDGITYSAARTKTFSAPANSTARLRFGRFGQQRAVAFKVTITGIAKRSILGLYADVEPDEV